MVLAEIKPWLTEEPDECVLPLCLPLPFAPFCFFPLPFIIKMTPSQQHPWSRQHPRELKPVGISVATDEHTHTRTVFKRDLQADAVSVIQIDSCRLAGVNQVLVVLLMTAKFGKPVWPRTGSVGLWDYVIYVAVEEVG